MEKENTGSDQKFDVIAPEAVISIKMSTGYYKKVQEATAYLAMSKGPEQIKSAHEQIKSQNITDDWVSHYETMLILCKEFEQMAKDGGHIRQVTMEELQSMLGES